MTAFFDWIDKAPTIDIAARIALKERLNEARCAEVKARRVADEAKRLLQWREEQWETACAKVRQLEAELKEAK